MTFNVGDIVCFNEKAVYSYSNSDARPFCVRGIVKSVNTYYTDYVSVLFTGSISETEVRDSCLRLFSDFSESEQTFIKDYESFRTKYLGVKVYDPATSKFSGILSISLSSYSSWTQEGSISWEYYSVPFQSFSDKIPCVTTKEWKEGQDKILNSFADCSIDSMGLGRRLFDFFYRMNICNPSVLSYMFPNVLKNSRDELEVTAWLDAKGRNKGREGRQTIKIGRLIKKLNPALPDSIVEKIVDQVRLKFNDRKFTISEGTTQEEMKDAYLGEMSQPENIQTSYKRKSAHNSCMRHGYESQTNHPTEAYASGDFKIVVARDSQGLIASRVLVCVKNTKGIVSHGPIYGTSEQSLDVLQEYLDTNGIIEAREGSWIGASLLSLPQNWGGLAAPYLDISPKYVRISSECMTISTKGDAELCTTSGLIDGTGENCQCYNCEDWINEGDSSYYDGECYCESCFYLLFFNSDYDSETYPVDDRVEVRYTNSWSRIGYATESWTQEQANHNAREIDGEYWKSDDLSTDYQGDLINPLKMDEYFQCSFDNELYPVEMLVESIYGDTSLIHMQQNPAEWYQDESGIWQEVELREEVV